MCACQKSYTLIIMTSITWAGPRCVQEAAAILGPQNRIQGRCDVQCRKDAFTCILASLFFIYVIIDKMGIFKTIERGVVSLKG